MDIEGTGLGCGVRVIEAGSGIVVISEALAMGWRARDGQVPGTAVRWGGQFWEVIERGGGERVERWSLEPWLEGTAMRRVVDLDAESVRRLALEQRREVRGRRWRALLTVASPVLGLAPGKMQRRWQAEYGYPAMAGVVVSSVAEMVAGAFAVVQLAALGFSGTTMVPDWAVWLMVPAPLLLVEGMLRLLQANAHGEPMGSILGAPLLLIEEPPAGRTPGSGPEARPGAVPWILGTTLLAVAICFAPREFQERWARRENVAPWVPTAAGAGFELLGGVVDILRDGGVTSFWSLLSLALVAEGTVRLVLLGRGLRPVGSLLGLPFRSFYRRLISGDGGSA